MTRFYLHLLIWLRIFCCAYHAGQAKLQKHFVHLRLPKASMENFNLYIKEVVKLACIDEPIKISYKRGNQLIEETRPKYAWVSSHTARRSFCTNEYLAGTPSDLIMAVSGHKTEKAFKKYIKVDHIKKARMIKKLWENQPGL